jgi:hypothetical protein
MAGARDTTERGVKGANVDAWALGGALRCWLLLCRGGAAYVDGGGRAGSDG